MKRAVVAAISLMTGLTMLTGCSKAEVEETIQPLVADAIEESDSEAEAVDEQDESPLIPEIDTDVKIEAGSRIAVVSKSVKGEYWKMVKKGMEDAVKAINDAYGFKKDDQITMTFEGPDNEEDVESQINTIDAVIAENPDVLCISASDMDSCQAQLEAAKENEIPVVAFDSNVSEKKRHTEEPITCRWARWLLISLEAHLERWERLLYFPHSRRQRVFRTVWMDL